MTERCASELNTNLRSCCMCESDQRFTKLISPVQPVERIQLTSMYVCMNYERILSVITALGA